MPNDHIAAPPDNLIETPARDHAFFAAERRPATLRQYFIGYHRGMPSIVRYLIPWKLNREEQQQRRIAELRQRDGENCARCRRPLRFDLPDGHDQGAKVEPIVPNGRHGSIDNHRLCHGRCNAPGLDHTDEVTARIRRKAEAELLSKSRKRRRKAA
jgi:hypothetical protein